VTIASTEIIYKQSWVGGHWVQ